MEGTFKNNRIDIMVDLETLGKQADSTIFQIAAATFDIKTGKVIQQFNHLADISKSEIKVDGSTLKWWLQTDKELLAKLLSISNISCIDLLYTFHDWVSELTADYQRKDIYLWGNGILFDNRMLKTQLETLGLEYPIHYKCDRDLRTLVDMACEHAWISETELKERYESSFLHKHDAMDDVLYQILIASGCYKILNGGCN